MQNSKTITAIDVGTTKVLTLVGKKAKSGRLEVAAHGVARCGGVRKGVVSDVEATRRAVRESVKMAERAAGVNISAAHVGISGARVSYESRVDTIDWVGEHGVITAKELERVPASIAAFGAPENGSRRKVIHAIPKDYALDGKRGVHHPIGMHANKLEVESHLVASSETDIDNLKQAVEGAGVHVESLVLESIASGEAALTAQERKDGAAMVDIGGGTTDIIIFKNGAMQYSSVIPIGGFQFTNDICAVYNTSYEAAEAVKVAKAGVQLDNARIREEVTLPIVGSGASVKASLHEICQLMRERSQELTRFITLKLREGGVHDLTGYRIALSGGASKLDGLVELIELGTSANVRRGGPVTYPGLPIELQSSECSTGVGILFWAASQMDDAEPHIPHSKPREREVAGKSRRRGAGLLGGIFSRRSGGAGAAAV